MASLRLSLFTAAFLLAMSHAATALAEDPPAPAHADAVEPRSVAPLLSMRPSGVSATAQLGAGTAGIQAGTQVTGHLGPMALGVAVEGALTLRWARSGLSGLLGPTWGLGPLYIETLFEGGQHSYAGGEYYLQAEAGIPGPFTFAGLRVNAMLPVHFHEAPEGLFYLSFYGRRDLNVVSYHYTGQSTDWSLGNITYYPNQVANLGLPSEIGIVIGGGFDID